MKFCLRQRKSFSVNKTFATSTHETDFQRATLGLVLGRFFVSLIPFSETGCKAQIRTLKAVGLVLVLQ